MPTTRLWVQTACTRSHSTSSDIRGCLSPFIGHPMVTRSACSSSVDMPRSLCSFASRAISRRRLIGLTAVHRCAHEVTFLSEQAPLRGATGHRTDGLSFVNWSPFIEPLLALIPGVRRHQRGQVPGSFARIQKEPVCVARSPTFAPLRPDASRH